MNESRAAFIQPSPTERWFNRLFGFFVGIGLGLPHNYLLQVQGRKTGRIYSTPVNILDYGEKRFLVAPRGETQWVRNARVIGQVWLKRGRFRKSFRLREVATARGRPRGRGCRRRGSRATKGRRRVRGALGPLPALPAACPRGGPPRSRTASDLAGSSARSSRRSSRTSRDFVASWEPTGEHGIAA